MPCQLVPKPAAVSESLSPPPDFVLMTLSGRDGGAKSMARFDLRFLIGAYFGGGIFLPSPWKIKQALIKIKEKSSQSEFNNKT